MLGEPLYECSEENQCSSVMQFDVTLLTRKTFRRALTRVNRANRYRVYAFGNVYDVSADLKIHLI